MTHFISIIPFLLILILLINSIKNTHKNERKKVKPLSFILLPILILFYLYSIFDNKHLFSDIAYIIFVVSVIIGGFIGFKRSKSYSFTINADGDVFYKKEIWDSIVLITLIIIEAILKYVLKEYEVNLFASINTALIILSTSSIVVRRFMMFVKYQKLKKNL